MRQDHCVGNAGRALCPTGSSEPARYQGGTGVSKGTERGRGMQGQQRFYVAGQGKDTAASRRCRVGGTYSADGLGSSGVGGATRGMAASGGAFATGAGGGGAALSSKSKSSNEAAAAIAALAFGGGGGAFATGAGGGGAAALSSTSKSSNEAAAAIAALLFSAASCTTHINEAACGTQSIPSRATRDRRCEPSSNTPPCGTLGY